MKDIPDNATLYKQTKIFDDESVPEGLLQNHSTAEGVWGRIVILEGSMTYCIHPSGEVVELSPQLPGVVEPAVLHHIQPHKGVRFYVEFFR